MFTEYDPLSMQPISKCQKLVDWLGGPVQISATVITGAGTLLVAQTDSSLRFMGFCIWGVSNIVWLFWARLEPGRGGVLVTYATNFFLNLLGIYNNWPRN